MRSSRGWVLLVALAVVVGRWWCATEVALGTFNIRFFPEATSEAGAVVAAIEGLDADAFAVQEIVGVPAFTAALRAASERSGRDYRVALAPYCKPDIRGPIYLGVVYDARRLALRTARAIEPGLGCDDDQPHGMVAVLGGDDVADFGLASVHLKAGGADKDAEVRRGQWAWLVAALPELEAELAAPIVVAGDFNSTGFHARDGAERRFIDEALRTSGRTLATERLECSMYWQPDRRVERWVANTLDHVLASPALAVGEVEARGMCARLACAEQATAPPEWLAVSDHCPVRAVLRR